MTDASSRKFECYYMLLPLTGFRDSLRGLRNAPYYAVGCQPTKRRTADNINENTFENMIKETCTSRSCNGLSSPPEMIICNQFCQIVFNDTKTSKQKMTENLNTTENSSFLILSSSFLIFLHLISYDFICFHDIIIYILYMRGRL